MILTALDVLESTQELLKIGFIVFLRVGAAMAVLPAFGETSIPQRIRLILALAFAAIVAPAVSDNIGPLIQDGRSPLSLIATEAIVGIAIGLTFRFFVFVLQIAGTIAAQSTSLSQIFGSAGMDPLPAFGHLLVVGGLALAVINNLHVSVAEVFILSYEVLPPGQFPDSSVLATWGTDRIAKTFALAFTLASPFVIASFLYNLMLGVINKAMPQLMVAFVGAPAITAGGLILLFLSMPLLLSIWHQNLMAFVVNPFTVAP